MLHGDTVQAPCAFFCVGLMQGKDCLYVYLSFGIVLNFVCVGDVVYYSKYCDI